MCTSFLQQLYYCGHIILFLFRELLPPVVKGICCFNLDSAVDRSEDIVT